MSLSLQESSVAKKACVEAGRLIYSYYETSFEISRKGRINLVTEVDEKAQELICDIIKASFPEDALLAEESELSNTGKAARRWIIDPIDGTTNFAHGYPCFCISIAFEKEGQTLSGVIYNPLTQDFFVAEKGKGAFCNERKLEVSQTQQLQEALLVTGFPYDLYDPETDNLPYFSKLLYKARAIRRDGSAALDLAYVAAGRFDGFWEFALKPWDVAAGLLLVEEAGGKIGSLKAEKLGKGEYPSHVMASNSSIFDALKQELAA